MKKLERFKGILSFEVRMLSCGSCRNPAHVVWEAA